MFFKTIGFSGFLGPPGTHASQWIRDLWSKGVLQILAYFLMFLSFCVLMIFSLLFFNSGFWVFFVHPTVISVLLSALGHSKISHNLVEVLYLNQCCVWVFRADLSKKIEFSDNLP